MQTPFCTTSKKLGVHRGGCRRENFTQRHGRVQTDIFLLHLPLGLDQPTPVCLLPVGQLVFFSLVCAIMVCSIQKRVTEPGGAFWRERRQNLSGGALCLLWEGIGESKVGLEQCESLARGKELWDEDSAEGREVRRRISRESGLESCGETCAWPVIL